MGSHCGRHNKDEVHTLILTDVLISAVICCLLPTTHHPPPGALWLQCCKSVNHIPPSIHRSIYSGDIGSVLPLVSEL